MPTVLIAGDSHAAGPPGRQMQERLEQRGYRVLRIGHESRGPVSYATNREGLWDEYRRELQTARPDAVLLVFGSNDAASPRLLDAMRRFRSESGTRVLYTGPPRYADPERLATSQAIREVASRVFREDLIDAYPSTGTDAQRTPDGLHFTRAGAEGWARDASEGLIARLSSPRAENSLPWIIAASVGAFALAASAFFVLRRR